MADRPSTDAVDAAVAFYEWAIGLIAAGDPRMTRIGPLAVAEPAIAERARSLRVSAWNMQADLTVGMLRDGDALEQTMQAKGVRVRDLAPPPVLHSCPLAPGFLPWLRIGRVPGPMLVFDERQALFPGVPGTTDARSVWETADPALVAGARGAYASLWEAARPWDAMTDRPLLPRRTRDVGVLLASGASDRDIAAELGIGMRTVAKEVRHVVDWTGARSRGHAVAILVGAG